MFSKLSYAAATSYNWSRSAISSILGREEMEALARQLKEKEAQLQRAEEDRSLQNARLNELSENLELESTENRTLWNQVEYLTIELGKERDCRKRHKDMYQQEILKNQELYTTKVKLLQQVQEMQNQQARMVSEANVNQRELEALTEEYNSLLSSYDEVYEGLESEASKNKNLCAQIKDLTSKLSQEREGKIKVENITLDYNNLLRSYNELNQQYSDFQEKYEMDIRAEQQTTATLEKKIGTVRKTYASRIKELRTQLEGAEKNLVSETDKNKILDDQIAYLTRKLDEERECKMKVFQQVEEIKDKQRLAYNELQQKYDMDMTREKERIAILEEKLQMMQKDNASRMLEPESQDMISECQKKENDSNLLKQQASQRDMRNLKFQLQEETLKNVQLVAQLQTEKELDGVLCSEPENLKDQIHQTEEPLSQQPEPLEESSSVSKNSVVEETTCVSLNPKQVAEESSCVAQDPDDVDEEASCSSQNPELAVEDSHTISSDTNLNAQAHGCEENATKKPSFWKKTRHFLGLRKKKKGQKCAPANGVPLCQDVTAEVREQKAVKEKHPSFLKRRQGSTSNATAI